MEIYVFEKATFISDARPPCILIAFSERPENKADVSGLIAQDIDFVPFA